MDKLKQAALNPPPFQGIWGIVVFVCAILFPGITQMIIGAVHGDLYIVVVGLLQFLFTFLLIGWFWSIAWGARALQTKSDGGGGGGQV